MRSTYSIVFTDRVWRRKVSFSHPSLRGSRKICLFIAPLSHSPLSPSRNVLVNRSLRWLLIDSRIYTHQREIIYVPIHATQSRYWLEVVVRKKHKEKRSRKKKEKQIRWIEFYSSTLIDRRQRNVCQFFFSSVLSKYSSFVVPAPSRHCQFSHSWTVCWCQIDVEWAADRAGYLLSNIPQQRDIRCNINRLT